MSAGLCHQQRDHCGSIGRILTSCPSCCSRTMRSSSKMETVTQTHSFPVHRSSCFVRCWCWTTPWRWMLFHLFFACFMFQTCGRTCWLCRSLKSWRIFGKVRDWTCGTIFSSVVSALVSGLPVFRMLYYFCVSPGCFPMAASHWAIVSVWLKWFAAPTPSCRFSVKEAWKEPCSSTPTLCTSGSGTRTRARCEWKCVIKK